MEKLLYYAQEHLASVLIAVAGFVLAVIFLLRKPSSPVAHAIGWRSIPQPGSIPLLGNLFALDVKRPILSMLSLSHRFRECFRLALPGVNVVVVNTQRLVSEVCNEKIFRKEPVGPLLEARNGAGDGLFTAYTDEQNWEIAHRILTPKLSASAVRDMLDEMLEITGQMVEKWESLGGDYAFDPTQDLNRLTLDTIALCALDLRLESFQRKDIHPFAPAMTYFLNESGNRSLRPSIISRYLFPGRDRKYRQCIDQIQETAKEAINHRKNSPSGKSDIMNAMLHGKDPKSGLGLPPQAIIYNTLTLLGAGFETTAGMLGFLIVLLMQHPQCMKRAIREVDQQLGKQPFTQDHLSSLPYLTACVRETLRLYPNAPGFQVKLRPNVISEEGRRGLGSEQYLIRDDDVVTVNLLALHRDPRIYGEDAEQFNPERMLPDAFKALPRNSWKPFGNGVRSCIGQAFALQEALVVVATLLQRFEISLADPGYEIQLDEALTLQPRGLKVFVKRRA